MKSSAQLCCLDELPYNGFRVQRQRKKVVLWKMYCLWRITCVLHMYLCVCLSVPILAQGSLWLLSSSSVSSWVSITRPPMALEKQFAHMCSQAKLKQAVLDFLVAQEVLTAVDFGLLGGSEESKLDTALIEVIKAGGVLLDSIQERIAVKKLWTVCRQSMVDEASKKKGSGSAGIDEPIPEEAVIQIKSEWRLRHNFEFGAERLLVESLQGKIYRELSGSPRRLSIYLAENLRLANSIDKHALQQVMVREGRDAKFADIIMDEVRGHFELYRRIRAFFSTVAWVMINDHQWFSFQDCEATSDRIMSFVNQTFDNRRPPLQFYTNAWASTLQRFSDGIRTTNSSLADMVKATAQWEHLWTMYRPGTSGSEGASSTIPDMDPVLVREVEQLRSQAKTLQSQRDRLQAEVNKRQKNTSPVHPSRVGSLQDQLDLQNGGRRQSKGDGKSKRSSGDSRPFKRRQ